MKTTYLLNGEFCNRKGGTESEKRSEKRDKCNPSTQEGEEKFYTYTTWVKGNCCVKKGFKREV